jgi:hypothetical protein
MFAMPDYLPNDFSQNVHDIMEGRSIMKVRGYTGEPWDTDALVQERRLWTLERWQDEWIQLMFSEETMVDRELWKGWAEKYHTS